MHDVSSYLSHLINAFIPKDYGPQHHELTTYRSQDKHETITAILCKDVRRLRSKRLVVVKPDEYQFLQTLIETAQIANVKLGVRPDTHIYCNTEDFRQHTNHS